MTKKQIEKRFTKEPADEKEALKCLEVYAKLKNSEDKARFLADWVFLSRYAAAEYGHLIEGGKVYEAEYMRDNEALDLRSLSVADFITEYEEDFVTAMEETGQGLEEGTGAQLIVVGAKNVRKKSGRAPAAW